MRYRTKRNEGVKADFAKLVGADKNIIIAETRAVLNKEKAHTKLMKAKFLIKMA